MHGSCVAIDARGLLILGPSGAGKSTLTLQLMAFGAGLVADDRTLISTDGGHICAQCPAAISGLIEARGVGVLAAAPHPPVRLALVVDLGREAETRLPQREWINLLGVDIPLVLGQRGAHFPALLLQVMRGGWAEGID